jgi:ribonuclease D
MPNLPEQIVTQPHELSACCEHLAACGVFGFDTEFIGENSYHPHLCLIQVATAERLYLIDPLSAGPLDAFWKLMADPANRVVVHAGREEVRLCRLLGGQAPGNLFDLQIAAGLVGLAYPLSHGTLVGQVLGVSLAKGETLTRWDNRPLTPAQVSYAFDDVRYLLPAWRRLAAQLEELDRSDWATEEFARLATLAAPELVVNEKWRKLRGLGSLGRRQLAVVRELFAWREELAERTNRPPRTIVRDDLLIEIARRNPTRERDLHMIRGLPRRDLPAVVEVVRRARELPLEQCPAAADREIDPPQVGWIAAVLSAVLGDLSARWRLAPNLVATVSDIKLLVRSRLQNEPPPAESLLTQGWRGRHVLPELLAVLDGRRSLRIADVKAAAPFEFAD